MDFLNKLGTKAGETFQTIKDSDATKKAKNYAEADRIRNELASRGITLIDTPNGTTYKIG